MSCATPYRAEEHEQRGKFEKKKRTDGCVCSKVFFIRLEGRVLGCFGNNRYIYMFVVVGLCLHGKKIVTIYKTRVRVKYHAPLFCFPVSCARSVACGFHPCGPNHTFTYRGESRVKIACIYVFTLPRNWRFWRALGFRWEGGFLAI